MTELKKKINIGFDIGTTSVGWSIIDDDYNIIDMGVRLFDDPANPKDGKLLNADRRSARSSRRRLRRIKVRKQAFKKLLLKFNIVQNYDDIEKLINIDITKWNLDNPIQLKVKALKEEISKEQMIFILFHYLHHRGFFHIDNESDDNKLSLENLKSTKYPSEEIIEFYNKNGYYKDSEVTAKIYYGRYVDEIKEIFKIQEKHLDFLSSDFQNEYIHLFETRRDFATGPGSEKSPTPWGMWFENEKGEIKKRDGENLWDATIGKCTYFPNEKRALKNTATSELFNLFNDLNNIYFFNNTKYKLTKEQKEYIFNKIQESWLQNKTKNVNLKLIIEAYKNFKSIDNQELNEDNIFGYRQDKNKKPIFTELKNYKIAFCWVNENKLLDNPNILSFETLNYIDNLLEQISTVAHDEIAKKDKINELYPNIDDENINDILKLKGLSQRHSLSLLAMHKFLEKCISDLDYNQNQMVFFNALELSLKREENSNNPKYIPKGKFDDAIISPTARRAFNENVKVMNRILELYGDKYEINNITIELPRDKNSAEERDNINKSQKFNENLIKEILKDNGCSEDRVKELSSKAKLRLKLWKEQQGIDIYDGNVISFNDALTGNGLEIDHIIPHQISGNDSQSNKVLVKKINNQNKSNMTPYQYFNSIGRLQEYIDRVNKYFVNKSTKKDNLLYENDPLSDVGNFIERNLVDTRYGSRVILNTFQDFFNNNENYSDTKIKVINGSLTNFARYNLLTENNKVLLHKDRDLYCHHAIDASIVCFLGMNHTIKQVTQWFNQKSKGFYSNLEKRDNKLIIKETGEVIDIKEWTNKSKEITNFAIELSKYNDTWNEKEKQIEYAPKSVKFSRKLVHKNNVKLSNETIYSFKWDKDNEGNNLNSGIAYKKINIFDDAILKFFRQPKEKLEQWFKNLEKLVIYKEDKKLYEKLKLICSQYNSKTPFVDFMKDNGVNDPKFLQIDNQRIKSLKVLESEKDTSDIIVLKNHSNNGILSSLNNLGARIYKDSSNNNIVIKINQKILTYDKNNRQLKIDDKKLIEILKQKNVSNFNSYIEIIRGTILLEKSTKKLYYSIGSFSENINSFEVKVLSTSNERFKPNLSSGRIFINLNKLINDYEIVNVDVLGNIYKSKNNLL